VGCGCWVAVKAEISSELSWARLCSAHGGGLTADGLEGGRAATLPSLLLRTVSDSAVLLIVWALGSDNTPTSAE